MRHAPAKARTSTAEQHNRPDQEDAALRVRSQAFSKETGPADASLYPDGTPISAGCVGKTRSARQGIRDFWSVLHDIHDAVPLTPKARRHREPGPTSLPRSANCSSFSQAKQPLVGDEFRAKPTKTSAFAGTREAARGIATRSYKCLT